MSRLGRFLLLERPRTARPGGAPPPAAAERFAGVEQPGPPPAPGHASGAQLERFAPPPERALELAEDRAGARPFTRCMACGMDHGLAVLECTGCGARLDTDAQRAFNDRLWAARLEEAARETADAAERQASRERLSAVDAETRRAWAESLAREIGERERARLDADGDLAGSGVLFGPLGVRILCLIPHAPLRAAAAIAALVAPLALLAMAIARPGARSVPAALGALALAAVFFSRPHRRP